MRVHAAFLKYEKTLYRGRDFLSDRSLRENTLILSVFFIWFL